MENNTNDAVHTIDIAHFVAGTYFITLKSSVGVVIKKIVKQ